ncbi:MAG: fibronectin type III domain-containing protein [Actinomycetota bacterium]
MRRRLSVSTAFLLISALFVGIGNLGATPASASPPSDNVSTVAFNSIPSTVPGNIPSDGFEATSASELGDYATFANDRPSSHLGTVDVLMSSWGCESGNWFSGDCVTTAGATFSEDVTFTIYENNGGGVGPQIAQETKSFDIPYRPSADAVNCTGDDAGKWYSATDNQCYNGFATPITFDFSNQDISLPSSVIYGVAYNTTHYGDSPIGESADCYTSSGGCGYDSLNVGVSSTTPTVGTDDDPDGVFQNSSWGGAYCDGGTGGTGSFRLDTSPGCWMGFNPDVTFNVVSPGAPVDLAQVDHNSASLAVGGLTDTGTVTLSATVGEPDGDADAGLRVQVAPVDEDFNGAHAVNASSDTTFGNGDTVSVTVDDLPNGLYHWRAEVVDGDEAIGDWASFGSNSDGTPPTTSAETDFVNGPSDPTDLTQLKPNGNAVSTGGNTDGEGGNDKKTVQLGGTIGDPDPGVQVKLRVQVAPTSEAFGGAHTVTQTSAAMASGSAAVVTVSGLDANKNYHWRAETLDAANGIESNWASFGSNLETVTDFRVPQANLSLTKSVLGSSGLTPGDHVNIAANAADLTATHTHTLIITLGVTNNGPDTARNTVVTDDVLALQDSAPTPHQIFDSATYCELNNSNNCIGGTTSPLPTGGKIPAGHLASGGSKTFQIFGNVSWQVRRGPVTLTNNASAESDVYSATAGTASKAFTVNTIPKFDVQPGNANAVVSWSPPPLADEAAVHHYRLRITGGPSPITVDPVPTTACTGRNGGTLCYNRTGLTNGTNYTFQLVAVTAAAVQRDGSEAQGKPSVDNKAAVVSTTTTSFSTCTTATAQHPICVTMTVPSGGGGVFSVQNAITGYSNFQFTNFCSGGCGLGLGSFEGHPPAGYNDPTHPIQLTVTWDRSAWADTENSIFYQADSLQGGVPFQLVKCTNQNVDTAFPNPCIKKTNVLGSAKKDTSCGLKAACFGDLQAQILLTSAADGGFAKKG